MAKLYLFLIFVAFSTQIKALAQNTPSLLFSESMINLNNTASLPPFEYIELSNNSTSTITLGQKTLHISTNSQRENIIHYSPENILIYSVYHPADTHSKHLTDFKGISLERTNYIAVTWHSASQLQDRTTPGHQNSTQYFSIPENKIHLLSKTFSPNNVGFEDEVIINYKLINPNYIIKVGIYNDKRQLVKKLAHQILSIINGSLNWDAVNVNDNHCPRGHYICYTKIFNHERKTLKSNNRLC